MHYSISNSYNINEEARKLYISRSFDNNYFAIYLKCPHLHCSAKQNYTSGNLLQTSGDNKINSHVYFDLNNCTRRHNYLVESCCSEMKESSH